MISFLLCLAILIVGYFVYGKIVDNTFGPDDRETPAVRINDGVDYVVMPQWKLFLVQLLNIAGLGPIFGAMQGALWGPVVFLWITFGTIFAGGVHDYFSGMMSERNDGASIAEITGKYLGPVMQNVMRVFSVVLLIMVGTVFAVGPAGLIVPNKTALTEYVKQREEEPGTVEACKLMLTKLNEELMKFRKGGMYEGMFPERWLPAVVGILPEPLTAQNGTVNSTSKVVRHKVYEVFREELDFLYTPEGKDIRNPRNTKNMKSMITWKI